MKIWIRITAVIAVVVVIAVLFLGRLRPEVTVVPAARGTAVNAVTGTVKVFSYGDVVVKTEAYGRLTELNVWIGDDIKEGDIIAVQESTPLQLRLNQAQIRLDAALAREEVRRPSEFDIESLEEQVEGTRLAVELQQTARTQLEREERELQKRRAVSRLEQIAQTESLALLQEQIKQIEYEMSLTTTTAPFDGRVVEVHAWHGDLLYANSSLIRLVAHGRSIEMTLSEEDFFGVEPGQKVTIRLASFPDRTFEGEVKTLNAVADADTKTRKVIVGVDYDRDILAPGLTGEAYLLKEERDDAIIIPRRALIGNAVYVIDNGKVEIRRVKPGFLSLNKAEILEGLEVGELVVIENHSLLRDNDRVNITESE